MQNKSIEFFTWIRKIEFINIVNYFKNYYDKENKKIEYDLTIRYLNLNDFKEYLNQEFDEVIKKFYKNEFSKNNPAKKDFYETLMFIQNYLNSFNNDTYDKIRKHKILYFIIAFAISTNKLYGLWKNEEEIFSFFKTENNRKMEWSAFAKGPVLKTIYNPWPGKDDELFLDNDQKKLLIFEVSYFSMKNFSTMKLIDESHKTYPWINNFKENKYYSKIEKKEIISYFKENKPFFEKYLLEKY
ncbi:/ / hypothetical protein / 315777:316553 Forward [Candidatus Hepatoplasma crinochetorum]|uniref:Uncharacterized protein n=1 Tax=Candidatus Hepatoplasma crinochetorum TaxID=295596 RepID=A0A0G7ZNK1_9MOLU|nr:/ / hypothetical protein / 315777:316553 Forward [Candidatus Hepatoplasma crinochetorum]